MSGNMSIDYGVLCSEYFPQKRYGYIPHFLENVPVKYRRHTLQAS
jgi:hypothetical protein